eukprot:2146113-Rhodomonas_salina.1
MAQTMLYDILAIRADRTAYYYGAAALWESHSDIVAGKRWLSVMRCRFCGALTSGVVCSVVGALSGAAVDAARRADVALGQRRGRQGAGQLLRRRAVRKPAQDGRRVEVAARDFGARGRARGVPAPSDPQAARAQ